MKLKDTCSLEVFATPWTVALQDPLCPWNSAGENTGMGKPFSSPGDLINPGVEPGSPALQAASLPSESLGRPMTNLMCVRSCFSCVWLFETLWTTAYQAPLSMIFSRQEYRSGVATFSSRRSSPPRDQIQVSYIAGRFFNSEPLGEALTNLDSILKSRVIIFQQRPI